MAIEVFNRQELKFLINETQYAQLLELVQQHMHPDAHNKNGETYRLYNVYIDTADGALIRRSLSKPKYKEKLRIRSYTPFEDDGMVFLEVKKRYKKITNKRRTKMTYSEALDFISSGTVTMQPYMNPQVIRELQSMLAVNTYYPKTYITYDRCAYIDDNDSSDLRVTFDSNVVIRRYKQAEDEQLLPKERMIMEVKTTQNIPLWLVQKLSQLGIYKQGFSKYGQEHLRHASRSGLYA